MNLLTPEQAEFVKENVKGVSNADLAQMVNERFGLNLTAKQMNTYKKNHKLKSGLDGRFKPGSVPHNKGKNIGGYEPTQFKKGHKPANHRPVGSERVNVDGYVELKIAEPNKWILKHKHIWQLENGPMPKGHAIIFGDGDKRNFDIDNLLLVTRKQLLIMNQQRLIQNSAELTKTGVIIADLHSKLYELKKAK